MENQTIERDQWKTRLGPLLSLIGAAIGLGNIWRFPMSVYQNGGGAFIIPYLVALLTAAIPLMILEMTIGLKQKQAMPMALKKINPIGEFLGWFSVLIPVIVMMFYSVIISWCLVFLKFSFTLEWESGGQDFFTGEFLKISSGPLDFGEINLKILISLVIVWGITFLINKKGISKGIEALSRIFTPLLIVLILIMTARSLFLDGAGLGLSYFLKPDFSKLANPYIWLSAYTQVFFSANLAVGVVIAYASYLPKETDIVKTSIQTVLANSFFDFVAGVLVFSVLGFLMKETGLSMSEIVKSGPEVAFQAIPKLILLMPGNLFFRQLFGILFFLSLIIAGISSLISMVESFASSFVDKFKVERTKAVAVLSLIGFMGGLIFSFRSGIFLIDIVNQFVGILGITFVAFWEIVFLSYYYGINEIKSYINENSKTRVPWIWGFIVKYLTPFLLFLSFCRTLYTDNIFSFGGYPAKANTYFGFGVIMLMIFSAYFLTKKKK